MQLSETFVKNKCNFFNFLVQQKLALVITILMNMDSVEAFFYFPF